MHAIYLDTDEKVDLDEIEPRHFQKWVDWAKEHQVGLDFNPTFFSHPMMKDGFTLASSDPEVRAFGLNTVNVHVVSQNISVKNLEKLATQTSGSQMDSKIIQ